MPRARPGQTSPAATLREVIRAAVADDGRTQRDIAAAAGLTAANLSGYLTGKRRMRDDSLDRLMAVLGLTVRAAPKKRPSKIANRKSGVPRRHHPI